jgi:hypothetical protein
MHDRPPADSHPGAPGTLPRPDPEDRCPSRFDRWLCALHRGHGGLHVADEPQGRTTWNTAAAGRRLQDL